MKNREHIDAQIERECAKCTNECLFISAALGIGAIASNIIGSQNASNAAKKAASIQSDASKYSADLQNQQYLQSRQDQMPWLQAGTGALTNMSQLMGLPTYTFDQAGYDKALAAGENPNQDSFWVKSQAAPDLSSFYTSPGYDFRLAEGEKAINRAAAARGIYNSGATLKDLLKYNQNTASSEFGDYWNRLAGLSGRGQTTSTNLANLGQDNANALGNYYTGAANAQAAGQVGSANAWASGLQGIGQTLSGYAGSNNNGLGFYGFNPGTAYQYNTNPFSQQTAMLNAQW